MFRAVRLILTLAGAMIFHMPSEAQKLSAFAGVGVGYDAFLRNASVTRYKTPWPFEIGVQSAIGVRYETRQSFDALLDITLGITSIRLPDAGERSGGEWLEQVQSLMMIGSGINIPLGEQESTLMPYVQIGAGFFDFWGASGNRTTGVSGSYLADVKTNRWVPLCGGGLDWQFRLFAAASFNLRFVYTPLDIFPEPVAYTGPSAQGAEELQLQGKLQQTIFTFRVYLPVKKWRVAD